MARITVFLHGDLKEKLGKERMFLKASKIEDLLSELNDIYPNLEEDLKFGRVIVLLNGVNIEKLMGQNTDLADFDLVSLTLKDNSMIDFFPPDGGG
ncbi:MAG: MoaD/ThiS family protein [Caldisericaceae bacterium]